MSELTLDDKRFMAAFERGTEGLEFFSVGACAKCRECNPAVKCKACDGYGTQEDEHGHVEWTCPSCDGQGDVTPDECDETSGESEFSWSACDACGSRLGGSRYPAHGFLRGELVHLSVCTDCLCYAANGDLPGGEQ